ncbi:hypothetical protein [Anabaena sp. CCY 0017]|uniref:hypothetical protein n=1 Tax=Anabaena sp. CCY 0017 TaxID=3103866 RepID=UPI0039C733D5
MATTYNVTFYLQIKGQQPLKIIDLNHVPIIPRIGEDVAIKSNSDSPCTGTVQQIYFTFSVKNASDYQTHVDIYVNPRIVGV